MSDLINRADAIEAVCGVVIDEFDVSPTFGYEVAEKALSALPSADAVEYESTVTLNSPISISAEAVQEWRTGKPTENDKYMVTLNAWGHRYIDIMCYEPPLMPNRKVDGACWYRSDDEWGDVVYDDKDILAWMPLPKPYREDGEV